MRALVAVSLVAGQFLGANSPVYAASFDRPGPVEVEAGGFAGLRLRLPLTGPTAKLRVSMTVAPMFRSANTDGRSVLRFGDGLGVGFSPGEAARVSFAGRPLSAFSPRSEELDKRNANGVSTLGWVAIGVGAAALLYVAAFAACQETNCLNSD